VHADFRRVGGGLTERAAQLEVYVFHAWIFVAHCEDVADPRNVLRICAFRFVGAQRRETTKAGVIEDEIQPREIFRRFQHVAGTTMFFVKQSEGQSLVHANVSHSQFQRLLPERISNLLIVQPPGILPDLSTGVHLPGIDLQCFDLAFHLIQFRSAEIWAQQPVT